MDLLIEVPQKEQQPLEQMLPVEMVDTAKKKVIY
jgi:hypothetical protein